MWELGGGIAALVYLGTLPLSGMIALLWLEGFFSRRRVKLAERTLRRLDPALVQDLVERRQKLIQTLDQARATYLARAVADAPAGE